MYMYQPKHKYIVNEFLHTAVLDHQDSVQVDDPASNVSETIATWTDVCGPHVKRQGSLPLF